MLPVPVLYDCPSLPPQPGPPVEKTNPTKPLVIFEMANNHMGSLDLGLRIVDAFGAVADGYRDTFEFGFKLQYRDLDSFIHPDFRGRADIKHIKRFQETRLDPGAFMATSPVPPRLALM